MTSFTPSRSFRFQFYFIFYFIILLALPACTRTREHQNADSDYWYTEHRQLYYGIPVQVSFCPNNTRLAAEVWRYLEGIDDTFNDYKDSSEIGAINANQQTGVIEISPDLANAFNLALKVYKLTNGAFDITIAPVRNLWKKAAEAHRLPTSQEIASALESSGLDKISVTETRLTVSSLGLRFDFGGIVKGIAVDHAIAMLKENGVRSAMVQIGGETAVFGTSPRDKPYAIGIQNPEDLTQVWAAVRDPGYGMSISTSGNYRNPITIAGQEFYHIIDPRTGVPIDTHVLSVSVVFPTTGKNWLADALATACAVIGPEKSIDMLDKLGGEVLFLIKENGKVREIETAGWDNLIQKD